MVIREAVKIKAIGSAINGQDPLAWPTIGGEPLSKFQVEGVAPCLSQHCFLTGRGINHAEPKGMKSL